MRIAVRNHGDNEKFIEAMKELENGNRITRELFVAEENIADSTLDIWCEKDVCRFCKAEKNIRQMLKNHKESCCCKKIR